MTINRNIKIRERDAIPFDKLLDLSMPGRHFFYVFDIADSEYEWFSDTISGVIGYGVDELSAMAFINNIHPEDKQALADIIIHLDDLTDEYGAEWLSHFSMMYDFRFRTKAGYYIRLLVQMVQQFDRASGRYKRYGRMTDITYFKNEGHTTLNMAHRDGGESYIDVPLASRMKFDCPFSKREKEIVRLVMRGLQLKEIADKLFISPETVKNHKKHIFAKTDCKSSIQLIKLCVTCGWKELYEELF